ncbi:MAG TPA: acyl-CoA dehydrogenase family protein [Candidatus Limnocylindrales bacterium]|nr:acyl-CoA dehydrogenase family protein [Candidatus Limnocylindrales bacterium]
MDRTIFRQEHEQFRDALRRFIASEITPFHAEWEKRQIVPRAVWEKAGDNGFLCPWMPEEYGGVGADFLYSVCIIEEMAKARATGPMYSLHSDIVVPYLYSFGSEEQKKRWLPGCTSGRLITAIAMTEPNAGSDLQGIQTTARRVGDNYVINGQKTFISNGQLCDLVIVVAKTNPDADPPYTGVSLIVVEAGTPGFERGRNLEKMGLKAQDTSELHFSDCVVPKENLLGEEGGGFYYLMQKLQQERLVCAIGAQAAAELVLSDGVRYCQERKAFGRPISKLQHIQFRLAEIATEVELGRNFVDRLIVEHMAERNIVKETSMAKYWVTEMLKRTCDEILQFHGGYGYMMEYPIARDYLDARIQTIYAGTTEIMKVIIAKQMGL